MPQDHGKALELARARIATANAEKSRTLSLRGLDLPNLDPIGPALAQLTWLRSLDLSHNRLTELPDWLAGLEALEELLVRGNGLVAVPDWVTGSDRIALFDAHDNPVSTQHAAAAESDAGPPAAEPVAPGRLRRTTARQRAGTLLLAAGLATLPVAAVLVFSSAHAGPTTPAASAVAVSSAAADDMTVSGPTRTALAPVSPALTGSGTEAGARAAASPGGTAESGTRTGDPIAVTHTTGVATPPATPAFAISGTVSCPSGNAVEGVLVFAAGAGGASPPPTGVAAGGGPFGAADTASYDFGLPSQEPYSLRIGCGGSPQDWAITGYTPSVSGPTNSFRCPNNPSNPATTKCVPLS